MDLVTRLLVELSDKDDEFAGLDREKILTEWQSVQDRFKAFIARLDNGEVVGILTLAESFAIYAGGSYGVINELYVSPQYRNEQVGKMLLDRAKAYARLLDWKRIDVTAPLGDKWRRTINFYLREGFVHTGPKLRYKW